MLVEQVKAHDEKLEAMTMGIQPVLDCIGLEQPERARLPGDEPYRSVVDHCWTTWVDFKDFACSAAHGAIVHTLVQLRSHYPLGWVRAGHGHVEDRQARRRCGRVGEEVGQGCQAVW